MSESTRPQRDHFPSRKLLVESYEQSHNPEGPSTQIVGFQGPKAIQSMDFGT